MQQTSEEKLEYWRRIIKQADTSQLGIPEWCQQNDITPHQLAYWRGKVKSHNDKYLSDLDQPTNVPGSTTDTHKGPFIELSIDDPTFDIDSPEKMDRSTQTKTAVTIKSAEASRIPEIRIETSSFKIYVTNGVDEQTLRMVLRVTADA